MPPPHTSIGILSAAITRLEANPHPSSLLGVRDMLDFVGREMSYPAKAFLANLWLFEYPIMSQFSKKPMLNAFIRYKCSFLLRGLIHN